MAAATTKIRSPTPKPAGSGGAPSMGAGAQSAGAPKPTFGSGGTPPASGAPKSPVTGTASSTATKSVSDPAKKPDAKKDDGAAPAAGKKADAPAEPAAGAKTAAASTKPAAGATSQTKQQAAKAQAEQATGGGGIWERLTGRGPKAATEPQSRTLREGNQRLPQADTSGWNLDTKLDLIGIGLILAALTLLLSALSAEQANVTGSINRFIGQLFGWGALAVPLTMGYVGVFLLVTRFGDTPPELDMVRLAGLVLAFLVALTIFQYVEVLAPRYQCDIDCFRIVVQRSFLEGRGGGVVGMNIHLFLIENIGEIAGFVLVVGLAVLSGMLMTRTTATELMVLFVSLYRSFRVSWQHQAQRRAASRQIAAQKRAEAAARISVSRPAALEVGRAPALGSEARQPALPLGASQEPMFRVGGQVISASGAPNAPATASAAPSAGNPALPPKPPRPARPCNRPVWCSR
ncbi:MAG: hypothetical protein MUC99_13225 [Anaerolineae bacterium]|nr:hypothetical protein [Anaerolineae bacterium]